MRQVLYFSIALGFSHSKFSWFVEKQGHILHDREKGNCSQCYFSRKHLFIKFRHTVSHNKLERLMFLCDSFWCNANCSINIYFYTCFSTCNRLLRQPTHLPFQTTCLHQWGTCCLDVLSAVVKTDLQQKNFLNTHFLPWTLLSDDTSKMKALIPCSGSMCMSGTNVEQSTEWEVHICASAHTVW